MNEIITVLVLDVRQKTFLVTKNFAETFNFTPKCQMQQLSHFCFDRYFFVESSII